MKKDPDLSKLFRDISKGRNRDRKANREIRDELAALEKDNASRKLKSRLTYEDLKFLKSLKISIDGLL